MRHEAARLSTPDPRPLYMQIQSSLLQRIGEGAWRPGDLLPTEIELAAQYGVSQGTVRKALIALEGDKLIVRRQGVGTYVARHMRDSTLFRFFRMVNPDGARVTPKSLVLRQNICPATREQGARLGLRPGTKLHAIVRLRSLSGTPAIYEKIFTPVALVPSLVLPNDGAMDEEMYVIYQERFNILIARVEEKLRATAAGIKEAAALGVPRGLPLIEIVRVAFDVNSQPIELRISRCDTRQHRYSTDIIDPEKSR